MERANEVVKYIYRMTNVPYKSQMLTRLTPVGRGEMEAQLIELEEDKEVLFRFQFKGEMLQKEKEPFLNSIN